MGNPSYLLLIYVSECDWSCLLLAVVVCLCLRWFCLSESAVARFFFWTHPAPGYLRGCSNPKSGKGERDRILQFHVRACLVTACQAARRPGSTIPLQADEIQCLKLLPEAGSFFKFQPNKPFPPLKTRTGQPVME